MLLCSVAATVCAGASAQIALLDDIHTVATAQTGVPVEQDFQVSQAGTYIVTLIDLGTQGTTNPLPLASLKMALTANDALVGTPVVVEGIGAPTPATGIGTITFTTPAAASYPISYRIHIVGAPASGYAAGPISLQVAQAGSTGTNTVLESWNDAIALLPQALPSTEALLQETYTVSTAGNYTVALSDLDLPQALGTLTMIFIQTGTSTAYVLPNPSLPNPLQQILALAPGTYQIYAIGQVSSGANGGLFSVTLTPPAGVADTAGWSEPVGSTTALGNTELSAGSYTFGVIDLGFPAALAHLTSMVVSSGTPVPLTVGGAPLLRLSAGQSGSFPVSAGGTYQVYAAAAAASAAPGAGSYAAQITAQGSTGAPAFSAAQVATAPGGTALGYALTTTIATAGIFTAGLNDFQTPAVLAVGDLALVQNGVLVGTSLIAPGTLSANLAAAPVTLLAIAQPGSGGSTFDLNLVDAGGNQVLDQPEGAGLTFAATKVSATTAGVYDITLSDLKWPAAFQTLAGIVTQGGTVVGQVFGGGTLNAITLKAGNYYVGIIATPATGTAAPDDAGTYLVNVVQAPAQPMVSLMSSAASVASGGTVQLSWTASNATSCTASGGGWTGTFTGTQATSDSATSPAITAATTFTLACTGGGGSASGTVNVAIQAPATSSKGGGGAFDLRTLLMLGLLLAAGVLHRMSEVS